MNITNKYLLAILYTILGLLLGLSWFKDLTPEQKLYVNIGIVVTFLPLMDNMRRALMRDFDD